MNVLAQALAGICRERLLDEKWLLAPSRRAAWQWLETIALEGRPAVNVRIETVRGLGFRLAGPALGAEGRRFLSMAMGELLIERVWRRRRPRAAYLSGLQPGQGLFRTMLGTIFDLRMAAVEAKDLKRSAFEVPDKGADLAALMRDYEQELSRNRLVDLADVLRLATERLRGEGPPEDVLLLVPGDIEVSGLEKSLLEAFPPDRRITLDVDRLMKPPADAAELTDAMSLRWLPDPSQAPTPRKDGTVRFFRAVGAVNEVREVFRRCLARGIPLDEVEILHTDDDTYVPLIYETVHRLASAAGSAEGGPLPVTLNEGIPARYTRPGRALSAWLAWLREDFPQRTLVRMIRDGLLNTGKAEEQGLGFQELATLLRPVPVGAGRDRYPGMMDKELARVRPRNRDADGEPDDEGTADRERRRRGLKLLRELIETLLELTPPSPQATPREMLSAAEGFLRTRARSVNELDNYARDRLLERIAEALSLVEDHQEAAFDAAGWLAALPHEVSVGGEGPRHGRLHVAHLRSGGHSGRKHTFVLGLDDSRFPGAGLQDPLLLDTERRSVSETLPTASEALGRKVRDFGRLLARLRGEVTLAFSCRDPAEDREMFASPVLMAAFRIASGDRRADPSKLADVLGAAVSFAPLRAEGCLDEPEWWLWRLGEAGPAGRAQAAINRRFPHLARGFRAAEARRGSKFTAHDGYVPEAGEDGKNDPTSARGPVMSTGRLERVGGCPLRYFFERVLKISPPEELTIDPNVWLQPVERGSLLHEVFRRFMEQQLREGTRPAYERDRDRIAALLEEEVRRCVERIPVPSERVFEAEYRELLQSAGIFLRSQEELCGRYEPLYLEAAIGLPSPAHGGSPIDTPKPVKIPLPGGGSIRARGRIDRVDRIRDGGGFVIWDYKTGSDRRYRQTASDPFDKGRIVQHVLYLALLEPRLREASPGARVVRFAFLFPTMRGGAGQIAFEPAQLPEGPGVLERLCRIVSTGAFIQTNYAGDCTGCEYLPICGEAKSCAEAADRKLKDRTNTVLAPFRELRNDARPRR